MSLYGGDGQCLRADANYHDHETEPMFVPASQPTDLPVAEAGAQRHRSVKAKEFGFEFHIFSVITFVAPFARHSQLTLQSDLLSLG
jgi:hypothetical protein